MLKDLLEKFNKEFYELSQEYIPYEGANEIRTLAHSHIEAAYQSNLERLIGKLNGGQFRLWDNEASVWWHSQWFSDNKMMTADGSTPTEAVENLIKALEK